MLPTKSNGPEMLVDDAVTASCHASSAEPTAVADQRGTCSPCDNNALTTKSAPTIDPAIAPHMANVGKPADALGTRRPSNWLATPPAIAPANMNVRMR